MSDSQESNTCDISVFDYLKTPFGRVKQYHVDDQITIENRVYEEMILNNHPFEKLNEITEKVKKTILEEKKIVTERSNKWMNEFAEFEKKKKGSYKFFYEEQPLCKYDIMPASKLSEYQYQYQLQEEQKFNTWFSDSCNVFYEKLIQTINRNLQDLDKTKITTKSIDLTTEFLDFDYDFPYVNMLYGNFNTKKACFEDTMFIHMGVTTKPFERAVKYMATLGYKLENLTSHDNIMFCYDPESEDNWWLDVEKFASFHKFKLSWDD